MLIEEGAGGGGAKLLEDPLLLPYKPTPTLQAGEELAVRVATDAVAMFKCYVPQILLQPISNEREQENVEETVGRQLSGESSEKRRSVVFDVFDVVCVQCCEFWQLNGHNPWIFGCDPLMFRVSNITPESSDICVGDKLATGLAVCRDFQEGCVLSSLLE